MYFLRDKKLAHDLHKGFVSEKQQMLYLLFTSLFTSLFFTVTFGTALFADAAPANIYNYISDGFYVLITGLTVLHTFKINQKGDDNEFIVRFICIGLPVTLKVTLLSLILGVIVAPIDLALAGINLNEIDAANFSTESGPATAIAIISMSLLALHFFTRSFKIASGQKGYGK